MTQFNPQLINQRSAALEKAIQDHLDFIEQSRANVDESQKVADMLKQGSARIQRWLALLQLNERLNLLRESSSTENASVEPALARSQLLRLAVEAGLSLQRASDIIDTARNEGKARGQRGSSDSGEYPLNGPQVNPTQSGQKNQP